MSSYVVSFSQISPHLPLLSDHVSLLLSIWGLGFVVAILTPTLPIVLTAEQLKSAVTTIDPSCCLNKFTDNFIHSLLRITMQDTFQLEYKCALHTARTVSFWHSYYLLLLTCKLSPFSHFIEFFTSNAEIRKTISSSLSIPTQDGAITSEQSSSCKRTHFEMSPWNTLQIGIFSPSPLLLYLILLLLTLLRAFSQFSAQHCYR